MNKISRPTRNNIFDILKIESIYWAGALGELDFLNRIFDLAKLPSEDSRFKDMVGDLWQHRVNNDDWEIDWVYYDKRLDLIGCNDAVFLQFLCELLHPVVRPNTTIAYKLQQNFNDCL